LKNAARIAAAFACAAVVLVAPAGAPAGEPPNQNDPCSAGGRDSCGTTGVGFYANYRYGIRWFGDYRGAVPGLPHTFCIDLRYWYPSPKYRFRKDTSATLKNRDGETVSVENRRRMAYAMWTFGQSSNPKQQAAVMLYVHSLMGDSQPGEVDPNGVGRGLPALFKKIAHDSARYHGPYRIDVALPATLSVGQSGAATVRVLAASGAGVPGLDLTLTAAGANVGRSATTDSQGNARVQLQATSVGELSLSARATGLPSTLPVIYTPAFPAAARNGQRLAGPASQVVTGSAGSSAAKAQIVVSSAATPATVVAGGASRDQVTIQNAASTFRVRAAANLFGPFRTQAEIACDGPPFWTGTVTTAGSGTYTTDPVKLDDVGWYQYQHDVPDDPNHVGVTTSCGDTKERVKVVAAPLVYTNVSSQSADPGAQIFDRVTVDGLAGQRATVRVALYGPFSSPKSIRCSGPPVWSGKIDAPDDGDYQTPPVKLTDAGYYTFHETLEGSEFVLPRKTRCGETSETTVVGGAHTIVSAEVVVPGSTVFDRIKVIGLRASDRIDVQLFGPYASRSAISCKGTPYWRGSVAAKASGTVRTPAIVLKNVGFYTFVERVGAKVKTVCGEAAETSLARPLVLTGRGDPAARARHVAAGNPLEPTRVRVAALGIDAPVFPVSISLSAGALAVPPLIHRAGWWADGVTPGSRAGATLIAGHVDSAKAGLGAFGPLRAARRGQKVQVTTRNGQTRTYRIVSVQEMPKEQLPTSPYSRRGRPRLVLVTCGGPFNAAIGHYRDNIVVTALPA
jgi:Sortase domain